MNAQKRGHDILEKIFHEPNRLAIVSAVCAADKGIAFPELRDTCGLTDGNLNRHLKVLEEANVVRIEKQFVHSKPRTTVLLTAAGLKRFQEYLQALQDVLEQARKALLQEKRGAAPLGQVKPVKA